MLALVDGSRAIRTVPQPLSPTVAVCADSRVAQVLSTAANNDLLRPLPSAANVDTSRPYDPARTPATA